MILFWEFQIVDVHVIRLVQVDRDDQKTAGIGKTYRKDDHGHGVAVRSAAAGLRRDSREVERERRRGLAKLVQTDQRDTKNKYITNLLHVAAGLVGLHDNHRLGDLDGADLRIGDWLCHHQAAMLLGL